MKSAVEIVAVLLLLSQLLSSFHGSSASTSIRGGGSVRNDRRNNQLRMLMKDKEAKEQERDEKEDKDATESPTALPTSTPTSTPSAVPSDVPSDTPTAVLSQPPVEDPPPLIIEADSNITENDNGSPTIGDVEAVYSDSATNLTAANVTNDDDEEPFINQTTIEDTSGNTTMDVNVTDADASTSTPTATPTVANITAAPTESPTEPMPCYWRFLTGESCTAHTQGDVINAYHHQYLLSDGDCHFNEFLGHYKARCEAETADEPARIWMTHVFCSDDTCGNCMERGIVQPEIYRSHTCNYIRVNDFSRNTAFDFAFEFVGGCFSNEACARMTVAGHGK